MLVVTLRSGCLGYVFPSNFRGRDVTSKVSLADVVILGHLLQAVLQREYQPNPSANLGLLKIANIATLQMCVSGNGRGENERVYGNKKCQKWKIVNPK